MSGGPDQIRRLLCCITLNLMLCKASHSLQFHCYNETCQINHYNSRTEGSFVFKHLPLDVEQLVISESSGLLNLSRVQYLSSLRAIGIHSSDVKAVFVPQCYALSTIGIINVPLRFLAISNNSALRTMTMKNTILTAIPYDVLQQTHLIELQLTNARLRTLRFDSLVNLTDLCGLDLSHNQLSSLIPDHTGRCCFRLKELTLIKNRLVHFDFGLLATMEQLMSVRLQENRLQLLSNEYQVVSSNSTPAFASLTSIIINDNLLPLLNLTLFAEMKALDELMVVNNRLEHIEVQPGKVPPLRILKVGGNALRTLKLIDLPELIEIHASSNQITNEPDLSFANSKAAICIANNPIEQIFESRLGSTVYRLDEYGCYRALDHSRNGSSSRHVFYVESKIYS